MVPQLHACIANASALGFNSRMQLYECICESAMRIIHDETRFRKGEQQCFELTSSFLFYFHSAERHDSVSCFIYLSRAYSLLIQSSWAISTRGPAYVLPTKLLLSNFPLLSDMCMLILSFAVQHIAALSSGEYSAIVAFEHVLDKGAVNVSL